MNIFKNWKTSLAGFLTLGTAVAHIINNPSASQDSATIGAIVAGLGLLFAHDSVTPTGSTKTTETKTTETKKEQI